MSKEQFLFEVNNMVTLGTPGRGTSSQVFPDYYYYYFFFFNVGSPTESFFFDLLRSIFFENHNYNYNYIGIVL